MKRRRIGFRAGDDDEAGSLHVGPTVGTIAQLTDAPADEPSSDAPFEARICVLSVNGVDVHKGIEQFEDFDDLASRLRYLLGRYGYAGNVKHISVQVVVPQLSALKKARDAINLAIAREEAKKF